MGISEHIHTAYTYGFLNNVMKIPIKNILRLVFWSQRMSFYSHHSFIQDVPLGIMNAKKTISSAKS